MEMDAKSHFGFFDKQNGPWSERTMGRSMSWRTTPRGKEHGSRCRKEKQGSGDVAVLGTSEADVDGDLS